jgi:hypothetical protein
MAKIIVTKSKLIELLDTGLSRKQISEALGLPVNQVNLLIKTAGLKGRRAKKISFEFIDDSSVNLMHISLDLGNSTRINTSAQDINTTLSREGTLGLLTRPATPSEADSVRSVVESITGGDDTSDAPDLPSTEITEQVEDYTCPDLNSPSDIEEGPLF